MKPVVLRKNIKDNTTIKAPVQQQQSLSKTKFHILDKAEDVTELKQPKVSRELAKKVTKARIDLKLTQEQLALKMNVKKKDITDFENCSSIFNSNLLRQLNKALGTNFSNKDN